MSFNPCNMGTFRPIPVPPNHLHHHRHPVMAPRYLLGGGVPARNFWPGVYHPTPSYPPAQLRAPWCRPPSFPSPYIYPSSLLGLSQAPQQLQPQPPLTPERRCQMIHGSLVVRDVVTILQRCVYNCPNQVKFIKACQHCMITVPITWSCADESRRRTEDRVSHFRHICIRYS
eukprot:sb/3472153/